MSYKMHPLYPLIMAANRDEFYERPSSPASFWDDAPDILGGRDLKEGGTWLGITRKGRIAALTNYRNPSAFKTHALSRGCLVRDYLTGASNVPDFLGELETRRHLYNGFNLILGEWPDLYYYSHTGKMLKMEPGLYGLSNNLLDTPWPKLEKGKEALGAVAAGGKAVHPDTVFTVLADRSAYPDRLLPDTGVGLEWERILSSIFISSPAYGTRSSHVLLIDRKGHVVFVEKVFNGHTEPWITTRFDFRIQSGFLPKEKT